VLIAGALAAASVCAAEPGRVTAVRYWSLGDVTRIAVEVSSDFTYKYDKLTAPERLFFDIHGAKPAIRGLKAEPARRGIQSIAVSDGLVGQIRVAETQPGVTRVVLDLLQPVAVTTSQLSSPNRLMIELRTKDKPLPPASPSVTGGRELTGPGEGNAASLAAAAVPASGLLANAKPEPNITPVIAAPALAATAAPVAREKAEPAKEANAVSPGAPAVAPNPAPRASVTSPVKEPAPARGADRSLTRALGLKLERVVLDAGHGGHDVGTHGPSGYYEKDLVLDVTLRLGKLIEERLGSEVIYTRSDDTFIPLEERTRIANEHKADLFLSIHANSSPYKTAAGTETYILNFTTSKSAMELAARENASSERSIHDLHSLIEKIALKDKVDESREFASRLQTSLAALSTRSNESAKNRGVKKAPFVVLIGAEMPSVLAEIGFLTNPSDEALLRKPEHRQKIAEALYKGIAAYADTLSRVDIAKKN
jgi:N-acetylmuramoyl-L-alanine amidase